MHMHLRFMRYPKFDRYMFSHLKHLAIRERLLLPSKTLLARIKSVILWSACPGLRRLEERHDTRINKSGSQH